MKSLQATIDRFVLWALGGAVFHAIALDHRNWAAWFILVSALVATAQLLREAQDGE